MGNCVLSRPNKHATCDFEHSIVDVSGYTTYTATTECFAVCFGYTGDWAFKYNNISFNKDMYGSFGPILMAPGDTIYGFNIAIFSIKYI